MSWAMFHLAAGVCNLNWIGRFAVVVAEGVV